MKKIIATVALLCCFLSITSFATNGVENDNGVVKSETSEENLVSEGDSEKDYMSPQSMGEESLFTEDELNFIEEKKESNSTKQDITIAVIDSGLSESLYNAYPERVLEGYNVYEQTTDVRDDFGHGTYVSQKSLIGSTNAMILPIKCLHENEFITIPLLEKAVEYAIEKEVDIINISLTTIKSANTEALEELINKAIEQGIKVVVSAGNDGYDTKYYSPANLDNAYVIGASMNNGAKQESSNYGDSIDYYVMASDTSSAAAYFSCILANTIKGNENEDEYLKSLLSEQVLLFKEDKECENQKATLEDYIVEDDVFLEWQNEDKQWGATLTKYQDITLKNIC